MDQDTERDRLVQRRVIACSSSLVLKLHGSGHEEKGRRQRGRGCSLVTVLLFFSSQLRNSLQCLSFTPFPYNQTSIGKGLLV